VIRTMPHLVVLYTPGLDAETEMHALCRSLADATLAVRDAAGAQVFPTGGVRVLAYPAAHAAVADGQHGAAFAYLNLRMGRGRSAAVHRRVGEALAAVVREHFAALLARRPLGLTLQIDEGAEVFDAKLGNLHAMYSTG
jgi:5-carboxymethyl-2-hydroxymuconate isomerase